MLLALPHPKSSMLIAKCLRIAGAQRAWRCSVTKIVGSSPPKAASNRCWSWLGQRHVLVAVAWFCLDRLLRLTRTERCASSSKANSASMTSFRYRLTSCWYSWSSFGLYRRRRAPLTTCSMTSSLRSITFPGCSCNVSIRKSNHRRVDNAIRHLVCPLHLAMQYDHREPGS